MTQRTEAEIRAAEAMRAAGDDEIVGKASYLATVGCGCNEQEAEECTHMRGGHCRRLADNIEGALRTARASADAEIAELRASLAKAEEALEPFAAIICAVDKDDETKGFAFDRYADGQHVFAVGKDRIITAGHLRHARAALSDLRKARGEAR